MLYANIDLNNTWPSEKKMNSFCETFRKKGIPFKANDNISQYLTEDDLQTIQKDVQEKVLAVLKALVIDVDNDPNTKGTAERIARMFVNEVFAGRYQPMPKATDFPNTKKLDDMLVVSTTIRSTCSHHFAPILGKAWIAVIPRDRVIGISKFSRLANWICARPQIQEEAAVQIADLLEEKINPLGIAIVIKASHSCMTWRGVKDESALMTTSVMRGVFRDDHKARAEFLEFVKNE